MATFNGQEGVWRTKNGRKIFIPNIRDYTKGTFKYKDTYYKTPSYYELDDKTKIEFMNKKEYKKQVEDFYNNLTEDEKEALSLYIEDPATFYGENPMFKTDLKYSVDVVNKLWKNKAYTTDKDMLVFRRSRNSVEETKQGLYANKMISTSAYDTTPTHLPSGKPYGKNEQYIIVPEGTKYLPIEKVATEYTVRGDIDSGDKIRLRRQHEILLQPNLTYELIKDETKEDQWINDLINNSGLHERSVVKATNKKKK